LFYFYLYKIVKNKLKIKVTKNFYYFLFKKLCDENEEKIKLKIESLDFEEN